MKRILICLFALIGVAQGIWAETYVTDMMTVAGGKSSVKNEYINKGWILAGCDLNKGAGGDYVYLLYKTGTNPADAITDVYITIKSKNTHPATIVQGGRTYSQVTGGHDLNKGAGGSFIFLYCTRNAFANGRKLTSLVVDETKEGAEGRNGTGEPAELNAGVSWSNALYLHAGATASRGIITDVMLIGSSNGGEFNSLKQQYAAEGWWFADYDLNEGEGGDYINLLYKTENDRGSSGIPITDFYLKDNGDNPPSLESNNRTYYQVHSGGNDAFNGSGCDLNHGAGGNYIFLYYTKDAFTPGRAVDKIWFDSKSNDAIGGSSSAVNLNGKSVDYFSNVLYMHVSTTDAVNKTAQALWCAGNNTLYFIYDSKLYEAGEKYNGVTVTQVWSGTDVTSTSDNTAPAWQNVVKETCTSVVFHSSFKDARPTSLAMWFYGFSELENVTDMQMLNTSEVTSLYCMFTNCSKLRTINVSNFDVRKVKKDSGVFSSCNNLTTIYCSNDWGQYLEGSSMFHSCSKLKGAVSCDGSLANADARRFANPTTGYFTGYWLVETLQTDDVTLHPNASLAYTNETVTVRVEPENENTVAEINVKGKRTGSPVSVTDIGNNKYTFQMPPDNVVITAKKYEPVAVWCAGNQTLYFAYAPAPSPGEQFMGQTVTAAWSGDDVTALSDDSPRPKWNQYDNVDANVATRVVFDSSFATVKPTNFSGWFYHMRNLSTIEGIKYLNTSAAYKISSMFGGATSLTTLDLNGFDVRNVTTADYMFNGCTNLTTIYCDNNWSFIWDGNATTTDMFQDCSKLKGAASYDSSKKDGAMANPSEGYFTGQWNVYLQEANYVTVSISPLKLYPNETVTITVTDELKLYVNEVESDRALKNIVAKGSRTGNDITVNKITDNTYTFTMPSENVNVSVEEKTPYTKYDTGVTVFADAIPYNGQNELTTGWYAVSNGYWSHSDRLEVSGDVNLILCDGVILYNPKGCAVNAGSKLTIWGQQKGNGKWIISNPDNGCAGIGGDNETNPGLIVINGGDIEVTGGVGAAGIGAGYQVAAESYPENAGRIDINYGHVHATGGTNGAGIGNGVNATITLSAGKDDYIDQTIKASSYVGTIILASPFSDGKKVYEAGDLTSRADELAGQKLVPVHGIVVYENRDNSETLKNYSGTFCEVDFDHRPLYKDGNWQTLCLPFAVSDFTGTVLEGAMVKTLTSATLQNGTLMLNFSENLTAIEAGKPYIVKFERPTNYVPWTGLNENDCSDIVNQIYYNKLIIDTPVDVVSDAATFHGIFDPYSTGGADNTMLYLGADNTLYYPSDNITIGAFRAYFKLADGITAGDPVNGVRAFVLNFGDDSEANEISDATRLNNNEQRINNEWYDLSGRRVSVPSVSSASSVLPKGVYINNGHKIVIK